MTKNKSVITAIPVLSLLVLGLLFYPSSSSPQGAPVGPQVISNAVANGPIAFDVSPPLREMINAPAAAPQGSPALIPVLRPKLQQLMQASPTQAGGGPLQGLAGPFVGATIGLNFDGVGNNATNNCPSVARATVAPPDTNAAVGDTQVVQWVNLCYEVFDKATGARIAGPFAGNSFWLGFKSFCSTSNAGDIIIQWDKANHVWVASQNVFRPFLTCVAVSTTADATGTYNRYEFPQPGFPDYPKWGLTPSVYYQTQNDFGTGAAYVGVNVCAYDAVEMRAGKKSPTQICIVDNSNGTLFDDSMLPADNDTADAAVITPEVLVGSIDNFPGGDTHVYQYVFTVTSFKKGTATLAGVNGSMPITVPAFKLGCGGFGACIPQPSPGSELLDALGDRLMYRLARSVESSGTQHFLVTHSVNDTAAVAARWYEFEASSGSTSLSLHQSGQTPDDGHYRWMGSVARDKAGNIGLGYSRSSASAGDYPSLYLSGQAAGEPVGTTDTESLIFQGSGSQFNTGNRWGDYSSIALDGADGCSFWYTNEYYPADGSFAWSTRIAGAIKFSGCQ
jgi:hypothetical protein